MPSKRVLIAFLVAVNVVIATALLLAVVTPPAAFAQASGRGGNFVCVTAKVRGQAYDAVYLLDRDTDRLHAFYPQNVQTRKHGYAQFRDLNADFGN